MNEKLHSKDFPDSFHRVSIKGVCVRDGKVAVIEESEELGGGWELPGGGLDFGEDIKDGFIREIREETGLSVTKISDKPVYIWTTRYENWRKMDWYYSLVLAYRIEFADLNITKSSECIQIKFMSLDELKNINHSGNPQTQSFVNIFDPKDFEGAF